jgi:hypothetical protein
MADERLERIRRAYAEAGTEQPAQYEPLPKWDTLPIQLREAIIHVYLVGRLDAVSEIKAGHTDEG